MVPVVALLVGLNLAGPGIPVSQHEHGADPLIEQAVGASPDLVAIQNSNMIPRPQIYALSPSRLEVSSKLSNGIDSPRVLPID